MFGAELIVKPIVNVDFLKLIFIGQRAASHVYVMPCFVIDGEYDAVAGIHHRAAHLWIQRDFYQLLL